VSMSHLVIKNGSTPLWCASEHGDLEVIEWLIASGRDLGDVKNKSMKAEGWEDGEVKEFTALEIAKNLGRTEVVSVLERFLDNPAQTRHEIRLKLVPEELPAEVFALIVFLCDDLLHLKPALTIITSNPDTATATSRFFTIALKLPMELQMILCHRVVGSMKQNILHKDSEAAFKSLARVLLSQSK